MQLLYTQVENHITRTHPLFEDVKILRLSPPAITKQPNPGCDYCHFEQSCTTNVNKGGPRLDPRLDRGGKTGIVALVGNQQVIL